MKPKFEMPIRSFVVLLLIALAIVSCGLFDDAEEEREAENEPLTSGVQLGDVVMAEGIGADNEPIGITDSFSSSQDYIYLVAEADHIESGSVLFARWSRDGEPFEDSTEVIANQDYEDTYIEFHLENLQNRFEEGDYSVELFVNGNPVEEIDFTVE